MSPRTGFLGGLSGLLSLGAGSTSVGLCIGASSIKLVELKKSGKHWQLLHFGMIQLPEQAIENSEIINAIAVVESLKSLISQIRLKNRSVCTSFSGSSMIVKRMTLDVPDMKQLQDQVFWEAEQYIPFDVSEVVMDYQVISKTKDKKADVLIVAVKRGVLDSYMACIEDAGLKPKIVDTDYFALQNAFEANYPTQPTEAVALVDIGSSSMKTAVVQGGLPLFTKDSAIGGRNLTQDIQRHLNLSYSDAETLKVASDFNQLPQEVHELMHVMSENLASEIKRSLEFYNASALGAPVSYVLLSGGGAKLPNLSKAVEETVGLPSQMMNPFNAITYDTSVFTEEYIQAIAPFAVIPIGQAIRAGMR